MNNQTVQAALDTSAAALTGKTPSTEPAMAVPRLVRWLDEQARRNGHKRADTARALGVTYGYLTQLRSGVRATSQISIDFARACAAYLNLPAALVLIAADRLSAADFCEPRLPMRTVEATLKEGLERMADDPWVGCLMPPEVHDAPVAVQQLLLALYEDATQSELFTQRRQPQLFWGLADACIVADEVDAEVQAEAASRAKAVSQAADAVIQEIMDTAKELSQ